MEVTEDTSQRLRSLLKSDADQNIHFMPVALDTSQALMFGLHVLRTSALAQRTGSGGSGIFGERR